MHMMVSRRRPALRTSLTAVALATALLGGLAGCGDETDPTSGPPDATDTVEPSTGTPSESTTQTPTETPTESPFDPSSVELTGDAGATLVTVLSASDAGGEMSGLAMSVEGRQAVDDFVAPLDEPFANEVREALLTAKVPANTSLWAAVAHIGCEAPAAVVVDRGEAGFVVRSEPAKNTVECLVPVTYVVVFGA